MHDFYSDTQTRPTRAMRLAALDVELGDERHDADPMTLALCERARRLLEDKVTVTVVGHRRLRIVTHLDVGQADADALINAVAKLA